MFGTSPNPAEFLDAIIHLHAMFQRYRKYPDYANGALTEPVEPLPVKITEGLKQTIGLIRDEDADARHQTWTELIADDTFGIKDSITYVAKGLGSWKFEALGTEKEVGEEDSYTASPTFLNSNWKMFHDALQAHRLYVLNELLPRFGLVSA
jgi:hypothetical protein